MNKPANLDFYSSDFSPTVYGSKQEYIENNPIYPSNTDEDYKKIADFMLKFHEDNQAFEVEVDKIHLDAIEHVYGRPLHFGILHLSLNHINDPFDTVVKNIQGTTLGLVYGIAPIDILPIAKARGFSVTYKRYDATLIALTGSTASLKLPCSKT